jgi:glutamate racemase
MKIGVFDSGIGGQAVAKAIRIALPEAELILRDDKANLPYGNKTPAELLHLVRPILKVMVADGCQIIVIACNSVSTAIITELRETCSVPLIAMEPMVKPAAELTKSGVIAVCATPSTLESDRYKWLKDTYAHNVTVIEPDCSDWAFMIENSQIDGFKIAQRISNALHQGADVIVLGCTHYHWIEHEIRVLCAGRARVLQPEQPVIAQLKRVIAQLT